MRVHIKTVPRKRYDTGGPTADKKFVDGVDYTLETEKFLKNQIQDDSNYKAKCSLFASRLSILYIQLHFFYYHRGWGCFTFTRVRVPRSLSFHRGLCHSNYKGKSDSALFSCSTICKQLFIRNLYSDSLHASRTTN